MAEVKPEAMNIALLQEIRSALVEMGKQIREVQSELEVVRLKQTPRGEVYPEKSTSVTDKIAEIDPGVGKWRCVSVYNSGDNDCEIQINRRSNLLTKPVKLAKRATKEFSYSMEVISKLYAKCASGLTTTLEIEFGR